MEILINEIERLPEAAAQFIASALPGRVYAFYGAMGAGKTTFIAELCRQLGSDDEASSPTFSIVNEYATREWGTVYHFDCYRLDSPEEAYDIGAEDYFASGNTSLIEWPEKIEPILPDDTVRVEITVNPDSSRTLRIYEDDMD